MFVCLPTFLGRIAACRSASLRLARDRGRRADIVASTITIRVAVVRRVDGGRHVAVVMRVPVYFNQWEGNSSVLQLRVVALSRYFSE